MSVRFPQCIVESWVDIKDRWVRSPLSSLRTDMSIVDPLPQLEKLRYRTKGQIQDPWLGQALGLLTKLIVQEVG